MTRSLFIAVVLAAIVGGWIVSGQIDALKVGNAATTRPTTPATGAREVKTASDPVAVKVRGRRLTAETHEREIVVRGRTEAARQVTVRAETEGRVAVVVAAEGARVARGDLLVRLAVEERQAILAEAEALVRQRQIENDAATRLAEKGYRAQTKTAEAAAYLDAAKAAVVRIETEIGHTVIRAPFDGVVEERHVEVGAYLKVGDNIATVIDRNPILVVAHVSERDVGGLRRGGSATATLITGEQVEGKIRYIATQADPTTRTFRVELEVPNRKWLLRSGVTTEIRLAVDRVPAHFVSPALLALDDEGVIGVRTVNEAGVVEFHAAEIVADEADGVWLGGLPQSITLITVGQEFVRAGDRVEVVLEEGGPAS
jgi:multidrug efflux system membrane fusion protein